MRHSAICIVFAVVVSAVVVFQSRAEESGTSAIPKVGKKAKNVELQAIDGKKVKLSQLAKPGPVVLVLLRGYPGYQCPLCIRQVGELRKHAKDFQELKTTIVLVYPGEKDGLKERAAEFLKDSPLPKGFVFAIDPGYKFTTKYGLRWDAEAETAYPATFVLDKGRIVKFRKVSKSHGDRAKVEEVLNVLAGLQLANSAKGREIPQDRGTANPVNR